MRFCFTSTGLLDYNTYGRPKGTNRIRPIPDILYYGGQNIASIFLDFAKKSLREGGCAMDAVGIVAEYNPFHGGHAYQIAQTRRLLGECAVVCVMSGHFVQRGECAVLDKWGRARRALEGGADLVLELPTPLAMSSAETFARGAVSILTAAGMDALSFGCETPDPAALQALADALNSPAFDAAVSPLMARGLSYPAARQRTAAALLGRSAAALLALPNNNLAVEYLRALPRGVTPLPIFRAGAHDAPLPDPQDPSAASLRALLRAGERADLYLPAPWQGQVYDLRYLERAILSRLRTMRLEELETFPDAGDGLAQRLWRAAQTAASLAGLWDAAKTKRLTHARLRRVTLRAALAVPPPASPACLRVLAMTQPGAAHLSALKAACPLPIVTKPARHKDLLAAEAALTDQFSLCAGLPVPCGEEFRHSPVLIGS